MRMEFLLIRKGNAESFKKSEKSFAMLITIINEQNLSDFGNLCNRSR